MNILMEAFLNAVSEVWRLQQRRPELVPILGAVLAVSTVHVSPSSFTVPAGLQQQPR